MQLPSPRQATTRREREASCAPIAAPRPHPRCPAEEFEKYVRAGEKRKFDINTSLLVGLSFTIKTSSSKSASIVRISRAALIGVEFHPARTRASISAEAAR